MPLHLIKVEALPLSIFCTHFVEICLSILGKMRSTSTNGQFLSALETSAQVSLNNI